VTLGTEFDNPIFSPIYESAIMNWDQIRNHWTQVCTKIKVTWGKLTEDDLSGIAGNRERLVGLLQQRYAYAKVQAEKRVDEFAQRLSL
jgi:uncharacterized protein YjbJ (UPF0337 family)